MLKIRTHARIHYTNECVKREEKKKINTHTHTRMHTHCDVLSYQTGYIFFALYLYCVRSIGKFSGMKLAI